MQESQERASDPAVPAGSLRVAVVGASGNVGTALLRRLTAQPEVARVVGVARRPVPPTGPYAAVEWVQAEVDDSAGTDRLAAAFAQVDAVVHLAWLIQPSHRPGLLTRTNVQGSRLMLEAAASAGVRHLVVVSSVGAYSPGPKDRRINESWPTEGVPTSGYSRDKARVERLLDHAEQRYPDLLISRLRPGLVFQRGAGSEIHRYFLGRLVPRAALGRLRLPVLPLPSQLVFQAVHADDLASACWTVLEHRAPGAFNVAGEPVLTPLDLARAVGADRAVSMPLAALRAVAALTWWLHLQPTEPGWLDLAASCPVMSCERLAGLGWSAQVSARTALEELIAGIRAGAGEPSAPLHPAAGQVRPGGG